MSNPYLSLAHLWMGWRIQQMPKDQIPAQLVEAAEQFETKYKKPCSLARVDPEDASSELYQTAHEMGIDLEETQGQSLNGYIWLGCNP